VDSANIASVSIQVISNIAAGPVAQLVWSTQPGLATNGQPFRQQPVLMTADSLGHPSVNGLPAFVPVTISQTGGAGPFLGTTNFNIGTAGSNGVVRFANLQINSAGASNQLTACVSAGSPASLLTNGNFNSPNSTATPAGWTTWTYGGGYANHELIAPASGVSGNYDGSYQMTCGAANTSGGGGIYQIVPAGAGLDYNLTADSGIQDWWWPAGEIRLFFLDANSNGLQTNTLSVTTGISGYDTGKPYQPYQLNATAPAGTTQAKVEFAGFGGGSVWFDNAVLLESNGVPALASATTLPFTVFSPASQTNAVLGIVQNGGGVFTLNFLGTVGARYYVQATTNLAPPVDWRSLDGSTNTVMSSNGLWSFTTSNPAPICFYRAATAYP
jgi:hypothetical protein